MAVDRFLDLFAHRFLCFCFLSVLVIPHVQQTKLASSRVNFSMYVKRFSFILSYIKLLQVQSFYALK